MSDSRLALIQRLEEARERLTAVDDHLAQVAREREALESRMDELRRTVQSQGHQAGEFEQMLADLELEDQEAAEAEEHKLHKRDQLIAEVRELKERLERLD